MGKRSRSSSSSSSDYGDRSPSSNSELPNSPLNDIIYLFIHEKHSLSCSSLRSRFRLQDVQWGAKETVQNQKGQFLIITDTDRDKKLDLIDYILNQEKSSHEKDAFIFIPESLVAFFIGAGGKAIKSLMNNGYTDIIVLPDIRQKFFRVVKITGKQKNILRTISLIYKMFQEKSFTLRGEQDDPSQRKDAKVTLKVTESLIDEFDRDLKDFCNELDVLIKFDIDEEFQGMQPDDQVMKIEGSAHKVKKSISHFLDLVDKNYKQMDKQFDQETLRMLIPNSYVTKMIGPGGSTIRQIAGNSGGAQIKILSSKESEKQTQDCIVTINGILGRKQEAVNLIFEKLERFKQDDSGPQRKSPRRAERESRYRSRSRSVSRRRQRSQTPIKERRNHTSTKNQQSPQDKPSRFKALISQSLIQKLTENNNYLLNKIQSSTSSTIIVFPGTDKNQGQVVEIRGQKAPIKKALDFIMDEQFKLE